MASSSNEDLSQQTLSRIMREIQSVQPHRQNPRSVGKSSTKKQNIVTVDEVLEEIRKLGDVVAASSNQTESRDQCQNSAVPGGNNDTPRSKFYLFKLPAEVRLMIYEASFPSRVLMFHPEGPVRAPYIGMRPLPPPAIACTCREAYYFSRERYHQIRYKPLDLRLALLRWLDAPKSQRTVPPPSHTWFNQDRDSLFIDIVPIVEMHQLEAGKLHSGWEDALFRPSRYNLARKFLQPSHWFDYYPSDVVFSDFIRSLRQFTTLARKVVLRENSFGSNFLLKSLSGKNSLLMYGSTEIFPNLQHISLATYVFVYPTRVPLNLKEILKVEDPVVLIDPYEKDQSNRMTTLLKADKTRTSAEETHQWERYLANMEKGPNGGLYPRTQKRSSQQQIINELRSVLRQAKAYMEKGFKLDTQGDKVYERYWLWNRNVLPTIEAEVKRERVPTIDPVCLVMENEWQLREITPNPKKPEKIELRWVRQRDSGGMSRKTA